MDFNFADLKKEAAATAEDIFTHKKEASDNAHTEHYFANEQKEADFEHVDPQTFVQRMSAGAKEAQEQLDAKFTEKNQEVDDLLSEAMQDMDGFAGQVKQEAKQHVAGATHDFMQMERGMWGDFAVEKPKESKTEVETKPVKQEDLLGMDFVKQEATKYAPSAPLQPFQEAEFLGKGQDSDTDSASVSCNPSPAKKQHPVADALKEQANEQFISSEDLLDLQPELKKPASVAGNVVASAASVLENVSKFPTTDLDADDFESGFSFVAKPEVPATPPATPTLAPAAATPPVAVVSEPIAKPTPPLVPTQTKQEKPAVVVAAKEDKKPTAQPTNILPVEQLFYKYGLDTWFKPERLHPHVESLIYWRDVKKSGIVFGAGMIALLAISCFSVISVFAYMSLFALIGTVAFRLYKSVMQAIQKTSEGHPFKEYLEIDMTLSQEKVQNIAGVVVAHVNGFIAELRRLFLVEDLIDSIKFGAILWVLTYIGAWFNGMTLVILAFVSLFTLPKVYENNKQSIDTYLDLVRSKWTEIYEKIKAAIPIGNKKPIAAETDKDK